MSKSLQSEDESTLKVLSVLKEQIKLSEKTIMSRSSQTEDESF
ncbi:hypothetical protein [Desertivirga brevis]|nr:hypothetical protein [Pedobacter sp. SYSU D00873]